VNDDEVDRLFDLADLILAVGRQIRASPGYSPDWCTPVESAVMRFIDRNPGTSARAASEATLLPSSNFSRALRGLEEKGLVRRDVDTRDARGVQLYPTGRAQENLQNLRETWSRTLEGTVDDPETIDVVNAALRRIENELIARRQRTGEQRASQQRAGK
jgi:MarR family transcriptional regulator, temperature-dependent positive regulator of motility